jgi:predicted alpha/beta superfamily hydrolase
MTSLEISVRYPLRTSVPGTQGASGAGGAAPDRLVLRTARDWDADVAPVSEGPDGARFSVRFAEPYLALKPCLIRDGKLHWSVGDDYVLSASEPDPEVWPSFFSPARGEVSELLQFSADGRSHAVRVYTPPGYHENVLRTFPVLYMQDGKNLFFPEEAFGGNEWRVDETMDRLDQMNAVRKVIVVGIAPADRMRDYTHPGYADYGRFLIEVVKPAIDATYRTRRGPGDTVVLGSSLGGVVSLFLAWNHPEVFGGAACLSSTFGYRDELFQRVASESQRPIRIYLDSGWPRDNFHATNAMRDLLVKRGFSLGHDLLAFSYPEGRHGEGSWAERLHLPFQFFFGRAWAASRAQPAGPSTAGRAPIAR